MLRRDAWGAGLAFEAARAALRAAAGELPDQPVLAVTQTANHRAQASRPTGFQGNRHLRGVRRAADSRRGLAGLVPAPHDRRARANQRGVSSGMPGADRRPQASGRAA